MPDGGDCNRRRPDEALEIVAALIDGKLSASERDALVERLEADERLYELLLEAAELRRTTLADLLN